MYQVQVNKQTVQNHIQYDWWKYLVVIIVAIIVWTSTTDIIREKQIPEDQRMEVFLVGDFVLDEKTDEISQEILKDITSLKKFDFINIPLSPVGEQNAPQSDDPSDDPNDAADRQLDLVGQQKLMVMLGSGSGDIFIFDRERYKQFAKQGAFMSLDDKLDQIPGLASDKDKLNDLKVKAEDEKDAHVFGVPIDDVTLFEGTGYDAKNKVMSIMSYSKKPDKAFDVFKWILSKR